MGEKLTNLIKEKTIKVNLIHKHFIHTKSYITWHSYIASYIYSYLKEEYRVKKGFTPDKNFRKTFEEKEGNSNRSEFLKNSES